MTTKPVVEPKSAPVCPKCNRKTIYFRMDGSRRCTACGYDSKREME